MPERLVRVAREDAEGEHWVCAGCGSTDFGGVVRDGRLYDRCRSCGAEQVVLPADRPSPLTAPEFDLERDCIEGHRAMRGLDDEQRHDRLRQVSTSRPSDDSAHTADSP